MTGNQIRYHDLMENIRHNQADEEIRQDQVNKSYQASIYNADRHYAGVVYASDNALIGTKYSADRNLEGTKYSANMHYKASTDSARISGQYSLAAARTSAEATKYASDNNLLGTRESNAQRDRAAKLGLEGAKWHASQTGAFVQKSDEMKGKFNNWITERRNDPNYYYNRIGNDPRYRRVKERWGIE